MRNSPRGSDMLCAVFQRAFTEACVSLSCSKSLYMLCYNWFVITGVKKEGNYKH